MVLVYILVLVYLVYILFLVYLVYILVNLPVPALVHIFSACLLSAKVAPRQ